MDAPERLPSPDEAREALLAPLLDLRLRDFAPVSRARPAVTAVPASAVPCIDVHNHLGRWLREDGGWMVEDVAALLAVMDECGVATVVNLDGRWGSELVENVTRYDSAHPGRFVTFCQLDWSVLAQPNGTDALVRSLAESRGSGARGIKVWKDLGLTWRDEDGDLVLPGDARIAPVFAAAGELGLPVLIHTADPVAFFAPLDETNERVEELTGQPDWWFGDASRYPTFPTLMESLESLVSTHPGTTFIGAHVGCNAEDLRWVGRMLTAYPNFSVDLGGRLGELGRQPRAFRRLVIEHPQQVLFGTDAFPATAEDYRTYFRFLESDDEDFPYAPGDELPPQGRWQIAAAHLPPEVLPAVYADNARRLLGLEA